MSRLVLLIAFTGVLVLRSGHDACAAEEATPAAIEQAIRDLSAGSCRVRERAEATLWSTGPAALPALRKAAASDDPEVAFRARSVLNKADFGIWPDTPSNVCAVVTAFKRTRDPETLRQLFVMGDSGLRSLQAIAESKQPDDVRAAVARLMVGKLPQMMRSMLEQDRGADVERLLEMLAASGEEARIRDYAVWLLQEGRIAPRIAQLKAQSSPSPAALLQLVYLCRTDGDLASAIQYAAKLGDHALERNLREEAGDWKALVARTLDADIGQLKPQATCRRLAGQKEGFEAALAALRSSAERPEALPEMEMQYVAETFIANNRLQDALDCLARAKMYVRLFDLLLTLGRYDEAFRLVKTIRDQNGTEVASIESKQAIFLADAGESEAAAKIVLNLLSESTQRRNGIPTGEVLDAAVRVGMATNALEMVAAALDRCEPQIAQPSREGVLWSSLFGGEPRAAYAWYPVLRARFPDETTAEIFRRLYDFSSGKPEVLREFETMASTNETLTTGKIDRQALWHSLAHAHAATGGLVRAADFERKACEASRTAHNFLRLAKALALASQWSAAAEAALEADRISPSLETLWARGWTLSRAGHEDEGRTILERVDRMALANETQRFALRTQAENWSAEKEERRHCGLIVRAGRLRSWEVESCLYHQARLAYAAGNFVKEAVLQDIDIVLMQARRNCFNLAADALVSAAMSDRAKAHNALAGGHVKEALEYVRLACEALPLDTDLTIELVQALEKAGQKADADALFQKSFQLQTDRCRRFPRNHGAHNRTAWLAVRLRRELPAALDHARRAVELSPQSHESRDTFAEVLFQLGRRDEAVTEMKKCIEQAPANEYYRRQLKRMQEGNPASDPV